MTPAARRAAALCAALRHPDALGVSALNRWAAPTPRPQPARASFDAALARPVGDAAMGAAWDARRPAGAAPRKRWAEDTGPVFGGWTASTAADALRGVR